MRKKLGKVTVKRGCRRSEIRRGGIKLTGLGRASLKSTLRQWLAKEPTTFVVLDEAVRCTPEGGAVKRTSCREKEGSRTLVISGGMRWQSNSKVGFG